MRAFQTVATILAFLFLMSCNSTDPESVSKVRATKTEPVTTPPPRDNVPERVLKQALETLLSGQSINWQDQTTGGAGSITPTRTFRINDGSFCRDYTILFRNADVGGYMIWRETACRNGEGRWHMIKDQPTTTV